MLSCFFSSLQVYLLRFKITSAAITPGIHPASVKRKTIRTDPHPLSMTARGGKRMARITLNSDIIA